MPNNLHNTCSVADFQKQAKKHLRRLKKTGQPEILTLNGHAEAIVLSPQGYQDLIDRADLLDSVQIIRKRMARGPVKGIPAEKFLARVREKLGIKDSR